MFVGYAHCSPAMRNENTNFLTDRDCEKIFIDTDGRSRLDAALEYLRAGDTLVVRSVSQLAPTLGDLMRVMSDIRRAGCHVRLCVEGIDTTNNPALFDAIGLLGKIAHTIARPAREEVAAPVETPAPVAAKTRKPRVEMTPQIQAHLLELVRNGMAYPAIATELNLSESTVVRHARLAGERRRAKSEPVRPETISEIRQLLATGKSHREIAARTGISTATVSKVANLPSERPRTQLALAG